MSDPTRNELWGTVGAFLVRQILKLRYRITYKGLDKITDRKGVLFLPNHPSHFDPLQLVSHIWTDFKPRPMAIDYCFWVPVMKWILKYVKAFQVPNFDEGFSPMKMRRMEALLNEAGKSLMRGENMVIYPAGSLMRNNQHSVGGASGVHYLLQNYPGIKVVLVRSRGMWGSIGGTAYNAGVSPKPLVLIKECLLLLLKNFIFLMPKREVTFEFELAPDNFPWKSEKLDFNRWLDDWYHKPDFEQLNQVSYSFWCKDVKEPVEKKQRNVDLEVIPSEIQSHVMEELARISNKNPADIDFEDVLSTDLGIDSLDRADIIVWLDEQYNVRDLTATEISTVASVMELAANGGGPSEEEYVPPPPEEWKDSIKRPNPITPQGSTIQESFLKCCDRMNGTVCMADDATGVFQWSRFKMACLILADRIREWDEDRVGIMMPASVGATMMVHATLLANKTPVMINWTQGPRNLEHVEDLTGIKRVLTSIKFVDRLGNIELGSLERILVFIEDLKDSFTLEEKLRGFFQSKLDHRELIKSLDLDSVNPDDESVILFTSGSENVPKGVPLSHKNILTNLTDVYTKFEYWSSDVIYGFLPPFHSFGYVITTILPTITGVKIAYYPNPTDARRLARGVESWKASLMYGTPSFISAIFKAASPGQLKTVNFIKVGAEKAPEELFQRIKNEADAFMVEGYGITECSPILTINELYQDRQGVGFPFPSVEILIFDMEKRVEKEHGEIGMILACGDSIFNGYLGNPRDEVFVDYKDKKWYVTGDLGHLNENGAVVLAGRKKRFVKVAGEMVSLPAIESILVERWPGTEEGPTVAVESLEVEGSRPVICLFATIKLSLDEVNATLNEAGFSGVARLNKVCELSEIPVLGTGKTDYRGLKAKLEELCK